MESGTINIGDAGEDKSGSSDSIHDKAGIEERARHVLQDDPLRVDKASDQIAEDDRRYSNLDDNIKLCQSFVDSAEEHLGTKTNIAPIVTTNPSPTASSEISKMKVDRPLPEKDWSQIDNPLTPNMINTLKALAANNMDVDEVCEKGLATKSSIGMWRRSNKTFQSYWNELVANTFEGVKADAIVGLGDTIQNLKKRAKMGGDSTKEMVTAGRFFKDILDSGDKVEAPTELTRETTYDDEGNIMSVKEQIKVLQRIRQANESKEDS